MAGSARCVLAYRYLWSFAQGALPFGMPDLMTRNMHEQLGWRMQERLRHEAWILSPQLGIAGEQVLHPRAMPDTLAQRRDAVRVERVGQLFVRDVARRAKVIDDACDEAGPLVGKKARAFHACLAGGGGDGGTGGWHGCSLTPGE